MVFKALQERRNTEMGDIKKKLIGKYHIVECASYETARSANNIILVYSKQTLLLQGESAMGCCME